MYLRNIFLVILIFIIELKSIYSQNLFGVSNSNYAGINSVYFNPANLSDSRFLFDLNLFTINTTFNNNVFTSKGNIFNELNTNLDSTFNTFSKLLDIKSNVKGSDYQSAKNNLFSKADFVNNPDIFGQLELRGPSFMIDIIHQFGIGLTTRYVSTYNIIDQMENGKTLKDIDEYLSSDIVTQAMVEKYYYFGNFKSMIHSYGELGLTLSANIFNNGNHFLKIGSTLKKLVGFDLNIIQTLRLGMQISDVRLINKLTLEGEFENLKYTNKYLENSTNINDKINYLFQGLICSSCSEIPTGYGLDLGFVYEYRPKIDEFKFENTAYNYSQKFLNENVDFTKNKYTLKFSMALQNLGYINYENKNNNLSENKFSISNKQNYIFKSPADIIITDLTNIVSVLQKNIDIKSPVFSTVTYGSELENQISVYLAPKITTQLDIKLLENIYVSTNFLYNIQVKYSYGTRTPTLFNITPRYETSLFDLGLPITYNAFNDRITYGLGLRFGPLTFGLDDMNALFFNFKGVNTYLGLRFYLRKGKPFRRFFNSHNNYNGVQYSNNIANYSNPKSAFSYDNKIQASKPITYDSRDLKVNVQNKQPNNNFNKSFDIVKNSYNNKLNISNDPSLKSKSIINPENNIKYKPSYNSNFDTKNINSVKNNSFEKSLNESPKIQTNNNQLNKNSIVNKKSLNESPKIQTNNNQLNKNSIVNKKSLNESSKIQTNNNTINNNIIVNKNNVNINKNNNLINSSNINETYKNKAIINNSKEIKNKNTYSLELSNQKSKLQTENKNSFQKQINSNINSNNTTPNSSKQFLNSKGYKK